MKNIYVDNFFCLSEKKLYFKIMAGIYRIRKYFFIIAAISIFSLFHLISNVYGYTLLGSNWSYMSQPMGESVYIWDNTTDTIGIIQALSNSMASWTNSSADFQFSYGGRADRAAPSYDSFNQIRWAFPASTDTWLAITSWWSSSGKILEADILFNDNYVWATGDTISTGTFDVESVALHEFGHVLGLGHSVPPAVMQPTMSSGIKRRVLTSDDINGILALYGGSSSPPSIDTIPPTISIANPLNNSYVKNVITISASASDDVGVSKVEFYKDADSSPFSADAAAPYETSLDTKILSNGSHILKAKAYDGAGNNASSSVSAIVDNAPPVISITEPINNAIASGNVVVSAGASDNFAVQKVEFYRDSNILLGVDFSSPYSVNWDTLAAVNGAHAIIAKAIDLANNAATSSIVVNVSNAASDSTAPNIYILNPANGSVLPSKGNVKISVSAYDASGISKIQILFDNVSKIVCYGVTSCSYTLNVNKIAAGTHYIGAAAIDNASSSNIGNVSIYVIKK